MERPPLMSSLRGNNGPRYRHDPGNTAPFETIQVDKLTPIIGAEISGVDLSAPSPTTRWMRSIARWRTTRLFSSVTRT